MYGDALDKDNAIHDKKTVSLATRRLSAPDVFVEGPDVQHPIRFYPFISAPSALLQSP
jgi:hypothetical protein